MAGSVPGYCYLTADAARAASYARALYRKDRPSEEEAIAEKYGVVFAFELPGDLLVRLEEDDLGAALRVGVGMLKGQHDGFHRGGSWDGIPLIANRTFGAAFAQDKQLVKELVHEAAANLCKSDRGIVGYMNKDAYLGRKLAGRLSEDVGQQLVEYGINIATNQPVFPCQAWRLEFTGPRALPQSLDALIAEATPLDLSNAERTLDRKI